MRRMRRNFGEGLMVGMSTCRRVRGVGVGVGIGIGIGMGKGKGHSKLPLQIGVLRRRQYSRVGIGWMMWKWAVAKTRCVWDNPNTECRNLEHARVREFEGKKKRKRGRRKEGGRMTRF